MMWRYVARSVWHYRRTHLIVMLAVVVSTAVIGGSLIVGDSVRSSLQQMTLLRLGRITHVLHSPGFVRQQLANDLADALTMAESTPGIHPGLLLTGSIELTGADGSTRRAGSAILLGLSTESWSLLDFSGGPDGNPKTSTDPLAPQVPSDTGIFLGDRTAREIQAKPGDKVSVWIERPSAIPRDSLLGERDEVSLEILLTVESVLPETAGASRFSLNPGQQLPYNAFLSLETLQERLGLQQVDASARNPIAKAAKINLLLISDPTASFADISPSQPDIANRVRDDLSRVPSLNDALKSSVALADVGLNLRPIAERGYVSVESDSMIIEDSTAAAVSAAADHLGMDSAPTMVYLANEIKAAESSDDQRYSMYSIIAGLPFDRKLPLGPFVLSDGSPIPPLTQDDIILSDWLSRDLQVEVGDVVEARWHEVGSDGELPETHRQFTVRGILNAADPVSVDPNLTPFVDGVTNVESFSDWDQPFEMETDRITARDDDYWAAHKATPKAFVSLAAAEQFWNSRFGRDTSIRIGSPGTAIPEDRLKVLTERLDSEIRPRLDLPKLGLGFQPVRATGLQAAVGANDFSQLFLGFSFFLILSAILLASLMFRLGIQQRIAQIGLLQAIGYTTGRSRWFFMSEGLVVAVLGASVGVGAAVGFAQLMIYGLTHWWVGAIGTQFLHADVQPKTLIIAAAISLLLAVIVIWQSLRVCTRRPPRELLNGLSFDDSSTVTADSRRRLSLSGFFLVTSVIFATALPALLMAEKIPSTEAFGGLSWRIVCFFLAGFAWLATGLQLLRQRLRKRCGETVETGRARGILRLAIANAARSPQRSLLTTALIAFATFVIVAVGAGRRNPVSEMPDLRSGNGGFTLVAQSSQPILFDLNTETGRTKLDLGRNDATTLPAETRIYGFSMKPGQDASCLNLYQTSVPTLLGASPEFIERGGFRFADTKGENPWSLLQIELPDPPSDGSTAALPTIPVIGDMNTLQFSLKKGIGDTILFPNDATPEFALQVVGMLDASIFQGVLVMSDRNLKTAAPETSGSRYFLVETAADADTIQKTASVLETGLSSFGVDTEPVNQRLAGFLAVQNTYLSTFQLLGGLGLLVGTFGLTAVMMRNVVERRSEIALLKAVGFTTFRVVSLIMVENSLLLFWGILTGAVSALIAMLPHLRSTGADVPWMPLGMTLAAVAVVGSLAVIFPVRAAARTSIRENLAAG